MSGNNQGSPASNLNISACCAEYLEGTNLPNGWEVVSKISKHPAGTGGHFSIPYLVQRVENGTKRHAFLKVLNLRRAFENTSDPLRQIQHLTTAFNFERDTVALCKSKRLGRVAHLLEDGQIPGVNGGLPTFYIILEMADQGDIRQHLAQYQTLDLAWTLRTLHQVAVGINQLHTHGIAHQDIKPSNVLLFSTVGAKVADLGCADSRSGGNPRSDLPIPGDYTYAPPELLYNEVSHDWAIRRLGCDLYHLGSLVVFFFSGGASMTSAILGNLHPSHKPGAWPHDFRSALPYVRDGFEKALDSVKPSVDSSVQQNVIELIRFLCEPDPRLRGHPLNARGSQFNLERIISTFNVLATRAEFNLLSR